MRDSWGSVDLLLERLIADNVPPHNPDPRYYKYIRLPLAEFFAGLEVARSALIERNRCWTGEESFLDVGSGIGIQLALASAFGFGTVAGVERHEPYADLSRQFFPEFPIALCDAFDYSDYGRFDVVYSYRLCVDLDLQRKLTSHMIGHMRPGALLFLAGGPDPEDLTPVSDGVWEV